MSVKQFLKEWKPKALKEMDKDDRTYLLYDYLPTITEFYIKKGHIKGAQNEVVELFNRMEDPKFVKTLLRILKTKDVTPVDLGFAVVITNFLKQRHQKIDETVADSYKDAIDKILKKRVKKITKKIEIDPDLLKELLVIVPEPEAISDQKFVGIYVSRMLSKLYLLSRENNIHESLDIKLLKKLFKALFGEDMLPTVAVNILLERKEYIRNFNESQKATWNLFTNFALDILESLKKKDLKYQIEMYVERRYNDAKKDRDSARRIQFAQISEEEYPRLHAVASKLRKNDDAKKYL